MGRFFKLSASLNVDSKYTALKLKNDETKIVFVTAVIMDEVQYDEYKGAVLVDEKGLIEKEQMGTFFKISEAVMEDGIEKRYVLGTEHPHTPIINFEMSKQS